jgi:putative DNA primase/helicase
MNKHIIDKDKFIITATDFFIELFEPSFNSGRGNIEIRTFKPATQKFFKSEPEAANHAYQLLQQNIDVYFGINPRIGDGGRKENISFVSAFHAEIDYGKTGHKKESPSKTYEEALNTIQSFNPEPTIVIHSGGGFHCYWVLSNPVKVSDIGIDILESINKTLSQKLGGDSGTHDISRVLRIPGTFNFKIPENPRPVSLIENSHKKYNYEDFEQFISAEASADKPKLTNNITNHQSQTIAPSLSVIDIDALPISGKMKNLIKNGNDGSYNTRSEADMAVITVLVNKGFEETQIKQIFQSQAIGQKYREHPSPDEYLKHTIASAKEKSNLTEEEMQDPLFICNAVIKTSHGYTLKITHFERYMTEKHRIRILDPERAIFLYNGKCYEQCTEDNINKLCQEELEIHRELFSKAALSGFMHYIIGDALVNSEKVRKDQLNYLTLQNGLYKIDEDILIDHTPDIFTTNLLPYNYDPEATCPRFIQFLEEIFSDNTEKINFIQEAVGYSFHQALPTPGLFFLTGDGNNGKSIFINTITNLIGKENTGNVSFNRLTDEKYVLELFQKMINISGETPHLKRIETDLIKAISTGDWITGRELYNQPMKFRSFAKHFLAMNKLPIINDSSHGMWRRIWIIEFDRIFTEAEEDHELEDKLSGELSGIFNWALEGYRRLRNNKFFLKESSSMKLSKQEYRNEMDSVRSFARDRISVNPGNDFKLSDVYKMYASYCSEENRKDIEKKKGFRKILEDAGYKIGNNTKDNNQVYIFNVVISYE